MGLASALMDEAVAHQAAGPVEEAERLCRRVLEAEPGQAEALHLLGLIAGQRGAYEEAVDLIRRAIAARPEAAGFHLNLGVTLIRLRRPEEALAAQRQAVALAPQHGEAQYNLGLAACLAGDPETAIGALETAYNLGRRTANTLVYSWLALKSLGEHAAARHFVDLDRQISVLRLDWPPAFDSLDDFNDTLAETLEADPDLQWERAGSTTKGGTQTDYFGPGAAPVLRDFETELRLRLEAFLAAAPADPQDPWLAARPVDWTLQIWATLLDEAGHQAPHMHPAGWLSGVYYVQVPPDTREDDPDQAGWIEFGRPGYDLPAPFEPEIRRICPEPGLLVLFPSHLFHATVPTRGPGRRISIAFDLIPADPA
ncbi:MAG: tetratricopeptide repeat protein [Alphaproteobacteria bacterium]|nr:tetratricopeptide repeat protein [Alphaproteobacteria bacterium]